MSQTYLGWTSYQIPQLELNKRHISSVGASISYSSHRHAANNYALINDDKDSDRNKFLNDDYAVAIIGHPYWHDNELPDFASAQGRARVLLEGYKKYGDDIFSHIYGDYSFVILSLKSNEALLAIDRIGINKLYYSSLPDNELIFSTSLQAISSHPEIGNNISQQAIYNYLFFHVIPSPDTIYEGVKKLLPGHYLKFKNNKITVQRYWNPVFDQTHRISTPALVEELKSRMIAAINKCKPDDNTGTFLSGGLDSSTITGLLAQKQKTKSFTIGFDDPDYDESGYARIAANHFSTFHHEYYVTPYDVCDIVTKIAQHYDEPFGNSSVVPAYYCARLAKENNIKTLLAGDGGDELFGGNTRYVRQQIFSIYARIPRLIREGLIEPIIFNFPYGSKLSLVNKIKSYIDQANIPLPDRLETYNFLFRTPSYEIFTDNFLQSIDLRYPFTALHDVFESANTNSILNKMLFLDWKLTLFDNDLQKVNGMCELAGVNVRYPFLDDDIVSFSMQLSPRLKVNGHKLRYFYKHAMSDFLPKEILYKKKHGFGLPFGIWMSNKKPLKEMAYDSLASLKRRDIVNDTYIDNIINLHQSDHAAYYGEFIWVLMMLEFWFREHS